MISWETVGVSAFITLIFAVAILLVIRKSDKINTKYVDSIAVQKLHEVWSENEDIRDKIHEIDVSHGNRIDKLECIYNQKFARLEGRIFEEMQLRMQEDQELDASMNDYRAKLDFVVERIDDLAKSVEQPEKKGNER